MRDHNNDTRWGGKGKGRTASERTQIYAHIIRETEESSRGLRKTEDVTWHHNDTRCNGKDQGRMASERKSWKDTQIYVHIILEMEDSSAKEDKGSDWPQQRYTL